LSKIQPVPPSKDGSVIVCHPTNHRGAKGTNFLLKAIENLKRDGYDIELDLLEEASNQEAILRMSRADIVVDQLLAGYALAALEALALGKVVISGLEDNYRYRVFRRYSYLDQCPIIPASPESIQEVLLNLMNSRDSWSDIGLQSRAYVERYHSFSAATAMWDAIYERIWQGKKIDLINFYDNQSSR